MGQDGSGFWSASMKSTDVCVTASAGGRLGGFFCTRKSYVVSETFF